MSKRYVFEVADQKEDGALRAVLQNTYEDGEIRLSFQREPNFFEVEKVGTLSSQVIIARDTISNTIIALGSRSVRKVYVNGQVKNIGYLSRLRIVPEFRGGMLLACGYAFLKELHQDGQVPFYFMTILDDNLYAKKILTSRRAELPIHQEVGHLSTFALPLYSRKKKSSLGDIKIVKGSLDCLENIISFINQYNAMHQFAPFYETANFQEGNMFKDFEIENFYVALKREKIVGVVGIWDQSNYKQSVIVGYSGKTKIIKPFYNLYARLKNFTLLPHPGSQLLSFFGAFVAVEPGNLEAFSLLIEQIYQDWTGKGYHYFLIGLPSDDPLVCVLKKYRHIHLDSTIYVVYWKDGELLAQEMDERKPYPEIATL